METKEYRTIDKAAWGDGPWQLEPDKKQWKDEATGYPCLFVRHERAGHLCGYVGVPREHPLHGKEYDAADVEVHGGLTFAGSCQHPSDESRGVCHVPEAGEPDDVYWFGFDCAHAWDLSPAGSLATFPQWQSDDEVYRSAGYVERECVHLAAQLKALSE